MSLYPKLRLNHFLNQKNMHPRRICIFLYMTVMNYLKLVNQFFSHVGNTCSSHFFFIRNKNFVANICLHWRFYVAIIVLLQPILHITARYLLIYIQDVWKKKSQLHLPKLNLLSCMCLFLHVQFPRKSRGSPFFIGQSIKAFSPTPLGIVVKKTATNLN